jgi:hypothetical protein
MLAVRIAQLLRSGASMLPIPRRTKIVQIRMEQRNHCIVNGWCPGQISRESRRAPARHCSFEPNAARQAFESRPHLALVKVGASPQMLGVGFFIVRLGPPSAIERRTCSRSVLSFDPTVRCERW